jgi:hypothetical protein
VRNFQFKSVGNRLKPKIKNNSMAIWQYNIYFLPRQSLINKFGKIPFQLKVNNEGWENYLNTTTDVDDEFEDAFTINWWADIKISLQILTPFLLKFGEIQEWTRNSEGLRRFGNTSTNDICACFDEKTEYIQELNCRLDLGRLDTKIIEIVFEIAAKFNCLLMDKQARLFEPNMKELIGNIEKSNANKFVNNPTQFFEDLTSGQIKPE